MRASATARGAERARLHWRLVREAVLPARMSARAFSEHLRGKRRQKAKRRKEARRQRRCRSRRLCGSSHVSAEHVVEIQTELETAHREIMRAHRLELGSR